MKKLIAIALLACAAIAASAQTRFGVEGGFTSSQVKIKDIDKTSVAGYHAGVAVNVPLISGLALQPQLQYNVKGTEVSSASATMGFVEFNPQLQWGLDLVLLRPYIFAEPFVGYATNGKVKIGGTSSKITMKDLDKRFEYGFGVGAGIDLFSRVQVSLKYYWNIDDARSYFDTLKTVVSEKKAFNGLAVSVGVLF